MAAAPRSLPAGACLEPSASPDPVALRQALGRAAVAWDGLVAGVAAAHPPVTQVWRFAGGRTGWSLRLVQRDRILLYLVPQAGVCLAGIVLGDHAMQLALGLELPAAFRQLLATATRHAEGHGLRIPVATRAEAQGVERLVAAKLAPPERRRRRPQAIAVMRRSDEQTAGGSARYGWRRHGIR